MIVPLPPRGPLFEAAADLFHAVFTEPPYETHEGREVLATRLRAVLELPGAVGRVATGIPPGERLALPVALAAGAPSMVDPYLQESLRAQHRVSLAEIAVLPAFRGSGLADKLLDDWERAFGAGYTEIVLFVWKDAQRARAFYERRGFHVIEERPRTLTLVGPTAARLSTGR